MKDAFTAEIDSCLFEQASQRSQYTGRSRNRELGYLLAIGLDAYEAGHRPPQAGRAARSKVTIYTDERHVQRARVIADHNNMPVGRQINQLVRLAIVVVTAQDLKAIQDMLDQQGLNSEEVSSDQEYLAPAQTAAYEFQPSTSA